MILAKASEGFIAELTLRRERQLVPNVAAAGGCVVVHHRVEHRVNQIPAALSAAAVRWGQICVRRADERERPVPGASCLARQPIQRVVQQPEKAASGCAWGHPGRG